MIKKGLEKISDGKTLLVHKALYALVLALSLGTAIYSNYPAFQSDYIRTDDDRANVFWFHRLLDPELLKDDLLTDYAVFYEATGTRYLYTLAAYFVNPFLLAKIIPILFYAVAGAALYKMGGAIHGPWCGFILAFTFICYPGHLEYFNCGYSRIFAYPGLVLFLYFLTARQTKHLIWLIPLLSLFYPVAFLICAAAYFLWAVLRITIAPIGVEPKKIILHFLAPMIISACFILPKYALPDQRYGRLLTHEETVQNPGARKNGRNEILPRVPVYKKAIDALNEPFIILSFLVIFFFLGRESLKIPMEFWLFIISGLLLYELAYYFLLRLYFPYKYFRYTFPMAVFFVISLGFGRIVERIPNLWGKILSLVLLICVSHYFYRDAIRPAAGMRDYRGEAPLYEYLKTLPKDSLIAAPPYLADGIPLFSARKVLFNFELASPWFTEYYKMIKERTEDFFFAYYSGQREDIVRFVKKYGVDYIIVDARLFRRLNRERFYIDPYNDFIKKQAAGEKKFFLMENLDRLAQYRFDRYYVIDTARLL